MAGHPADVLVDDLVGLYQGHAARLEGIVATALRRGIDPELLGQPGAPVGTATAAYRKRQLEQARAVIGELERTGREAGPLIIGRAYRSGLVSVDRTFGGGLAKARGEFGRIHVRAVEALAGNLTNSLTAAAGRVGANVELAFARADALEGALLNRPGQQGATVAGLRFLGRRIDDPYRALALDTVAGGAIGLDTRRQVSRSLARRLVTEGVTDALTGFVDRAGRRWPLPAYTAMVARTTTREAMTAGTTNRMREHGLDLVTISSHGHQADECTPYDGNTYSLDGATPGYEVLDELPPFHPNCGHVATPAGANLDDFERELGLAASEPVRVPAAPPSNIPRTIPPTPPAPALGAASRARAQAAGVREATTIAEHPTPPPTTIPAPPDAPAPVGRHVDPISDDQSPERLDALLQTYALHDPGPEPGAAEAWAKYVERDARAANRALNSALGEFNAKYIDRKAFRELNVRRRLLDGELTVEEVEDMVAADWEEAEGRRLTRKQHREQDYGYRKDPIPCFSCGSFKRRPADVCQVCGDDPVSSNYGVASHGSATGSAVGKNVASAEERMNFNRAYGYGSL